MSAGTKPLTVPCPFKPCEARPRAIVEMPPPAGQDPAVPMPPFARPVVRGPVVRIATHRVEGPGSWFGTCPASLETIPLTGRARENLAAQARVFAHVEADHARRDAPPDSSGTPTSVPAEYVPTPKGVMHVKCGQIHGADGRCPAAYPRYITPNKLPPGPVEHRAWETYECGVCGGTIVRVPASEHTTRFVHNNPADELDGHAATPQVKVCDYCGKSIRKNRQGQWAHRDESWSGFGSHEIRPRPENRH